MKPDYRNWVPKGMVASSLCGALVFAALFFVLLRMNSLSGVWKSVILIASLAASLVLGVMTLWSFLLYRAFSYGGKRQLSRRIIEGIAERVTLPDGGTGLDVGCGSGALTIACAKRNPRASFVGIDRWGKEYASFSKALCERNAKAEGVENAVFLRGDANRLDFPDETFDTVVSNYVYHNIPCRDRQALLLETLRVLKKGGTFAIHDLFSQSKYGDVRAFVEKLRAMCYERVEWIETADGTFLPRREALWMGLSSSSLLIGKK